MKVKLGFVILIICAFVLGTCSTWEGDEGVINIRIVGAKGSSLGGGGGSSRTITSDSGNDDDDGYGFYEDQVVTINNLQLSDFLYDIYFVKKVYPTVYEIKEGKREPAVNNSIPKDNIGGGRKNVKLKPEGKGKVACSLSSGTWILIINGLVNNGGIRDEDDRIRAQGVKIVEIKPGKNDDIPIEMKNTHPYGSYHAPFLSDVDHENGVILEKGKHF
jgi:hypothetical protein